MPSYPEELRRDIRALERDIRALEADIKHSEAHTRNLRDTRQELLNKLAESEAPFKVGDWIRFKEFYSDKVGKEGIVTTVTSPAVGIYNIEYSQVLKSGKISDVTRRLWNSENIFEINGNNVDLRRA